MKMSFWSICAIFAGLTIGLPSTLTGNRVAFSTRPAFADEDNSAYEAEQARQRAEDAEQQQRYQQEQEQQRMQQQQEQNDYQRQQEEQRHQEETDRLNSERQQQN
jgi:hypothetical protein